MRSPALVALMIGTACTDQTPEPDYLDRAEMLDPTTCETCHPDHYREWSGSMHAYSGQDPLFRAMNARGQRETGGALGDYCVACHAPLAVREGLTTDGLDLDQVEEGLQGVTCAFCHRVDVVNDTHNGAITLSDGLVMRGGILDPEDTPAHASSYTPLLDRLRPESSDLCGSCHCVETQDGVHLERTWEEWDATLYSHANPMEQQSCSQCHMQGYDGLAATTADTERRLHRHTWPGVDVALIDFPEKEEQRAEVERYLNSSLLANLCVFERTDGYELAVMLENVSAGHNFPSGATQHRRTWLELVAYSGETAIFESGVVADDEALFSRDDPGLWWMGETVLDGSGNETLMAWDAASYVSNSLPGPTAASPDDPDYLVTHVWRQWPLDGLTPDRVTMKVRIRPTGLDVIDSLVASGDLDADDLEAVPTFDLAATELEWKTGDPPCVP